MVLAMGSGHYFSRDGQPLTDGLHDGSTWCLTSTETTRLTRDGQKGVGRGMEGGEGGGEGDYIPIATLSPPERLLVGSDESHFNVSLIVRDKVTNKTVSTNHNF